MSPALFIGLSLAGAVGAVCLGFWLAARMFEGESAKFFGGCALSLLGLVLLAAAIFAGCSMALSKI